MIEEVRDEMHVFRREVEHDDNELEDSDYERFLANLHRARRKKPARKLKTNRAENASRSKAHGAEASTAAADEKGTLSQIRSRLRWKSKDNGLPNPFEVCLAKGNDWHPLPSDWNAMNRSERSRYAEGFSIEVGWSFIQRTSQPLSDDWYVGAIAKQLDFLAHTPSDQQINSATRLGLLLGQWNSRRHYASVARGKKVKKSASKGGKARAQGETGVRSKEILAAMKVFIDKGHSVSRASQLANIDGFGTSPGANRKLWSRKAKK